MTKFEIYEMIKAFPIDKIINPDEEPWLTQYDDWSAMANYAFIRSFEPKVVLEFGTRGGRCTRDILRALLDNDKEFVFKTYEIDPDMRTRAQRNIDTEFGDKSIKIGGDVMKAEDIPDNIEYLFIDNSHDLKTTQWVFDHLLPKKTKPGALVHFHDMQVVGDDEFDVDYNASWNEMRLMQELKNAGKFPLVKKYFSWENPQSDPAGTWRSSSAWWTYNP